MKEEKQLTLIRLIGSLCSLTAFLLIGFYYSWQLAGFLMLYNFGMSLNFYVLMVKKLKAAMLEWTYGKKATPRSSSVPVEKRNLF